MSKQAPKRDSGCFRRFLIANEAVSSLEYALLIGVVTVTVGAAIVTFGDNVKDTLEAISTEIPNITIESTKEFKAAP